MKLYSKGIGWGISILLFVFSTSLGGCKKFLDEKPKLSQIVPNTLSDLQSLLDNRQVMNQASSPSAYAEMIADNYYVLDNDWSTQNALSGGDWYTQNYIWATNAHPIYLFWANPYTQPIYYSNIVLDRLPLIPVTTKDSSQAKAIKGSALFYRSFTFYHLAQLYCRPYASDYLTTPGIVLRLTADAGKVSYERATVKETYDQILAGLKNAANLLPLNSSVPTRPTQTAAYAMLARVYLSMRDYESAGYYADLALQQKNTLLDYNTVTRVGFITFPLFNPEVIFDNVALTAFLTSAGFGRVDTLLYQSYDTNDLRQSLFFKQYSFDTTRYFIGGYNGSVSNFSDAVWDGLATDELYLMRAECSARAGNKDSAMADLNRLLIMRWKNAVSYPVMTAATAADALSMVLTERRKELIYRGLRWMDIRRLNLEGANIILKRVIGGAPPYTLPPNDTRSVMLIPQEEIDKSGILQNPR